MSSLRITRAMQQNTPPSANRVHEPGDSVLLWQEKIFNNRIGEWLGSFKAMDVDESKKLVYVQDVKTGSARPFNIAQVKHYFQPENLSHCFISSVRKRFKKVGTKYTEEEDMHLTEINQMKMGK